MIRLHYYNPKKKEESHSGNTWIHHQPRNSKCKKLALKYCSPFFWDIEDVLVGFMHPKVTITVPYYSVILWKLRDAIPKKGGVVRYDVS